MLDLSNLFGNQVFSGGLALGAIGSVIVFARRYLLLALASMRRRFVTEFEVRESGMVLWLGLWLANTPYGKKCRRLTTAVRYQGDDDGPPELYFEPGPGPHFFRHAGILLNDGAGQHHRC